MTDGETGAEWCWEGLLAVGLLLCCYVTCHLRSSLVSEGVQLDRGVYWLLSEGQGRQGQAHLIFIYSLPAY